MIKGIFSLINRPSKFSRLFAKLFDYAFFYIIGYLASLFFPVYIEDIYYFYFALVIPLIWIPFEALCYRLFATTLGKFIFGIRITDHINRKLPYWIALKRASHIGILPGVTSQSFWLPKTRNLLGSILTVGTCLIAIFGKEVTEYTTGFEKYKTADGWVQYTSNEGGFSILFPSDPQEESKTLPIPSSNKTLNYNELKSYRTKKVYYAVTYMELPRKWKWAGASRLLQGALDVIVEHTDNATLLSKKFTKHKNQRALDFQIKQKDEEIQGRLILVGTTLFRLTVAYPPALAKQLQHQEFLDSFEIQPKKTG